LICFCFSLFRTNFYPYWS